MEDVEVFYYKLCDVLQSTAEEVIGKKKACYRRKVSHGGMRSVVRLVKLIKHYLTYLKFIRRN